MARKACGLPEEADKGARSGLFGWARRALSKPSNGKGTEDADESAPATLDPDHAKY
jgi:hypothetical protein